MSSHSLRKGLKRGLQRLGADIVRYPANDPAFRRVSLLNHFGVTLVLDVGANSGQYACELRRHGYKGRIVSFEPLSAAYEILCRIAAPDRDWTTVRLALGDQATTARINVAGNSYSSSFLPMLRQHTISAPESGYVATEEVPIDTIDDVFDRYRRADDVAFLKVDTQGYERQVLDGGRACLPRIAGLQLELSLVPLYADAMLYSEALERIAAEGFDLYSMEPGFYDAATGRMLQFDAIFFRPELETTS